MTESKLGNYLERTQLTRFLQLTVGDKMTPGIKILLLAVLAIVQASCQNEGTDQKASIRICFDGYKKAILAQDGTSAKLFVDKNTIDYYGKMRDLALNAPEEKVRKLSTIDKLMVLTIRHRIPAKDIDGMNGESLFVHGVEQGWIGKGNVVNNELGDIKIFSNYATGVHIASGQESRLRWTFRNENGKWKIDLTTLMAVGDQAFKQLINQSGMPEDQFILTTLESVSGNKVPDTIWQPIKTESEK